MLRDEIDFVAMAEWTAKREEAQTEEDCNERRMRNDDASLAGSGVLSPFVKEWMFCYESAGADGWKEDCLGAAEWTRHDGGVGFRFVVVVRVFFSFLGSHCSVKWTE